MCSRFAVVSPPEAIKELIHLLTDAAFPPREHIAPTEPIMIIRNSHANKREMVLVRWGLIPHWVKDPDNFALIINARAETLLEKPSFRTSLAHKRCLIPADAFYEWSGPKNKRQMHKIEEINQAPMAFAGLWDHWLGADGSEFESAVIITVATNQDVAPVHDRMPAIIYPQDFEDWLDVKNVRATEALKLLKPVDHGFLRAKDYERADPTPKKTPQQGELF